ncbi:hypothetical protein [Bordetella avium]|uniref:Uncharacterized protein n=1 Tax=Bordetella avium (strain 197N) TaxID=360910 RepID=Q2KYC0_BORA1|nr:hypothetical protein [Bordetella avium]AZY49656.1 hypothetical protein C0J09_11290 [Bordetella avium]AZY53009.1 hypothetical protein C0J07_11270 [Bordetella avium]RIQ12005.1 hypothetical protein D0432_15200 [Bordetella avium]RIQ17688.1 hypothetical protein D0850_09490 [Bordetella avium]RIQ32345.1 hypothetical protein D0849_12535 [Bordetella avium]
MSADKWDFRVEQPSGSDGNWSISYLLVSPGQAGQRIEVQERFPSAQNAIDEATRLAQIQIASLNGEPPELHAPNLEQAPFDQHSRF